jgi:hypothetical protein
MYDYLLLTIDLTYIIFGDIDVTWMDITMDINICMKAFYFGSSDLTVKCIQSKKKYLHVEVMFCLN